MGKIRKEKKYRMHLKAPGAHLGSSDASPLVSLSAEGVVPLSEDIMTCKAVISLEKKGPGESNSGLRKKKKERMKLKREHWLQSEFQVF